jgi:hypothetical protein
MGWGDGSRRKKLTPKELLKKAGKKLVINPVTGAIGNVAMAKTVGKYKKSLERNNMLCPECGKGVSKANSVHPRCAMAALDNIQPTLIADLNKPGGRNTADTWNLGTDTGIKGCDCNKNWAWHECKGLQGQRIDGY